MKISIVGIGALAAGTAIHEAIQQLREQGHEIVLAEYGDHRGLELDMMVVDECTAIQQHQMNLTIQALHNYACTPRDNFAFNKPRTYPTLREKLRGRK